jgi:hypothetical protein
MLSFQKGDAALTLDNSSKVLISRPWRNASSGNGLCFLSDSNAAVREFGTNLLQEADLQRCALSLAGCVLERQSREVQMRAASVDVPWVIRRSESVVVLGFFVESCVKLLLGL